MELDKDTYDKIIEMHRDIKHVAEQIDKMSSQLDDHEKRIRVLEKCSIEDHEERLRRLEGKNNRLTGRNAFVGAFVIIILQILGLLAAVFA